MIEPKIVIFFNKPMDKEPPTNGQTGKTGNKSLETVCDDDFVFVPESGTNAQHCVKNHWPECVSHIPGIFLLSQN